MSKSLDKWQFLHFYCGGLGFVMPNSKVDGNLQQHPWGVATDGEKSQGKMTPKHASGGGFKCLLSSPLFGEDTQIPIATSIWAASPTPNMVSLEMGNNKQHDSLLDSLSGPRSIDPTARRLRWDLNFFVFLGSLFRRSGPGTSGYLVCLCRFLFGLL